MCLDPENPNLSRRALAVFRLWVRLTKRPFTRSGGARTHVLQGRPRVNRLSRHLVRHIPFLRLVPPIPPQQTAATALPRRIWIYWDGGEDAAPELVRVCIRSWREKNPGWDVALLTAQTPMVSGFLARLPESLGQAHKADILRVALLADHGGVWADASTLCMLPLDTWLPRQMKAGFFAFSYDETQVDRPLANWFLASTPGAGLTRAWLRHVIGYWSLRKAPDHYFIHHYLFDWMLMTDPVAAALWQSVPRMPAAPMHNVQGFLKGSLPAEILSRTLAAPEDYPVQKLDWRLDSETPRLRRIIENIQ